MSKLISLLLLILIISSCSDSGKFEVDLSRKNTSVLIEPNHILPTSCAIRISGETKCSFFILIPGYGERTFGPGKFNSRINLEWYDEARNIEIRSDSCTKNDIIFLYYNFSSRYFGQRTDWQDLE